MRLVVDASVAAKWVLLEAHAQAARRVMAMATLLAPDLLWAELGNVLWKRQRRGENSPLEVQRMMSDLQRLPVQTYSSFSLTDIALDLAMAIDHSVYDCMYLALAETRNSLVVTADRRFHHRVRESVLADRILWIEDV